MTTPSEDLKKVLTPEEQTFFKSYGYVEVTGSDGNRYRIGHGMNQVSQLGGSYAVTLCCHPPYPEAQNMSHDDHMIMNILWIKTNAWEFMRIAMPSGAKQPAKVSRPKSALFMGRTRGGGYGLTSDARRY